MVNGVLDTTVVLHLFRKYPPAIDWIKKPQLYGVTAITWFEVMRGASSKAHQAQSKILLSRFELLYLIPSDQTAAMHWLEGFHFKHRIGMEDCLIAAVADRLQIPLYTHNLKHMQPLIKGLAIKPYDSPQ